MEMIHGFVIKDDTLFFWVTSSGFTAPEHFRLEVEIGIAGNIVTLERTQPDEGRMRPHAIRISLPKPEALGSESFTLANKFQAQFWLSSSETSFSTNQPNP